LRGWLTFLKDRVRGGDRRHEKEGGNEEMTHGARV
jgi:hypothetical protein